MHTFNLFSRKEPEEKRPESGYVFLYQYPSGQLYRIVVDQRLAELENGWVEYEGREPKSILNVLAAHQDCIVALSKNVPIDVAFYKNIHRKCKENIVKLDAVKGGEFISKETHGFPMHVLSMGGLMELGKFANKYPQLNASFGVVKKSSLQSPSIILLKLQMGIIPPSDIWYCVSVTKESSEEITQNIFKQLNSALKEAKNDNDIIKAIIDCVYELEHLHPFDDVNLRSCIVLTNVLLMKYGFPPVTYFNPNELDGVSKGEFFKIIKAGMVKTLEIIEKPDIPHFNVRLPKLKGAEKEKYDKMYGNIIDPIVKGRKGEALSKGQIAATYKRIGALESYPEPQWIDKYGKTGEGLLLPLPEEPPSTWSSKSNVPLSLKLPSTKTGSWILETPSLSSLSSSFSSFSLSRMSSDNSAPETPLVTPATSGSFASSFSGSKELKGEPDQEVGEDILEEDEDSFDEYGLNEDGLNEDGLNIEALLGGLITSNNPSIEEIREVLKTADPNKACIVGTEPLDTPMQMLDKMIKNYTSDLMNPEKQKETQRTIDNLNAIKREFEKTIQVNTQKVVRRQGPG